MEQSKYEGSMSETLETPKPSSIENNKTFEKDDWLDRKPLAEQITARLLVGSELSDESFVLSLNGGFGSGKTQFLDMFENYLKTDHHYNVIRINAWKNDSLNNPTAVIAMEFAHFLGNNENYKKLMSILLDCAMFFTNQAIKIKTGFNPQIQHLWGILKSFWDKLVKNQAKILYEEFSKSKSLMQNLEEQLSEFLKREEKPIFIFIDELDRSRPDYAILFLEAIKHFFSIKGIIFVLAVNRKQLEKSVKHIYGDINFNEYYRKFAQENALLPKIQQQHYGVYIKNSLSKYSNALEGYMAGYSEEQKNEMASSIMSLLQFFNFNPRQMNDFFRSSFYSLKINQPDEKGPRNWIIRTTLFYIAFRMLYANDAHHISQGTYTYGNIRQTLTGTGLINYFGEKQLLTIAITPNRAEEDIKDYIRLNNERETTEITQELKHDCLGSRNYFSLRSGLNCSNLKQNESIIQYVGKRVEDLEKIFD